MKVLLAHNFYKQPGGEDTAFRAEAELLRRHGHAVVEYTEDNRRIAQMRRADLARNTIWSSRSYKQLRAILRRERPDVVHFHNTFPLISPAAYYACRHEGVPVVQSLDNPRLICAGADFYRGGRLCTDCLGRSLPWPAVAYACYHDSTLQSMLVATMLTVHRMLRTWHRRVNLFLVATDFYRDLFVRGGLPQSKLWVKPHFLLQDPGPGTSGAGEYALFVGRLQPEKGIATLLRAWQNLDIPLKIRGDGDLDAQARDYCRAHAMESVQFIGRLAVSELQALIREARFLVWPSEGYYETFGYVCVESYAMGVPVLASGIGVMKEIVRDGSTGLLFKAGDQEDLAAKARWLWDRPEEAMRMGRIARAEYERKYTAERGYPLLIEAYHRARQRAE